MINWITKQGLLIQNYEDVKVEAKIEIDSTTVTLRKVSGNYPDGLDLYPMEDELQNIIPGKFVIKGILPKVNEPTDYYFTLEAEDFVSGETSQRYFLIKIRNRATTWENQPNEYVVLETTYVSNQLLLKNAHGNEVFEKISGEMPDNLQLTPSGLIYGVVAEPLQESTYYFTIGVKRDGEYILEKDFTYVVKKLTSTNEPIWITESGYIGSVNYLEESELFVSAYDPQKNSIDYRLAENDNLPPGLSINSINGRIVGDCLTQYGLDWTFGVIVSNGKREVKRDFIITTNALAEDDKMEWDMDADLGNVAIGNDYLNQFKVKSQKPVVYSVIGGELPKGLSLSPKGNLQGVVDFQEKKTYKFIVYASNNVTYLQKDFYITVVKGLGKNAVKAHFYINNENLQDYQDMRELFNVSNAYRQDLQRYRIPSKPSVELCKCNSVDKVLMRKLLSGINTPIIFNWNNTTKSDYIVDDEIKYSAYYKQIIEEYSTSTTTQYPKHPTSRTYVDIETTYLYAGSQVAVTPIGEIYKVTNVVDENNLITTSEYYFLNEKGERIYIDIVNTYYEEGTRNKVTPTTEVSKQIKEGKDYIWVDDVKTYIQYFDSSNYYIPSLKEVIRDNEKVYTKEYENKNQIIREQYVVRDGKQYKIEQLYDGALADLYTNKLLTETTENAEIYTDETTIRYYFDSSETQSVFLGSTNYLREVLGEKIYVEKLNKDKVFYKIGNQEIIDDELQYRHFLVKYDEDRKTYYVTYNGEKKYFSILSRDKNDPLSELKPVKALKYSDDTYLDCEYIDSETDKIYDCGETTSPTYDYYDCGSLDIKTYLGGDSETSIYDNNFNGGSASEINYDEVISGSNASMDTENYVMQELKVYEEWDDTDIDYHYYMVYEKDTFNPQENLMFTLEWKPEVSFIVSNGAFYMVTSINKPYICKPEENTQFGLTKTIVLPYINDDDIFKDGDKQYIKFFDVDTETLQEWKQTYFPSLDLFYSQPNTNIIALAQINAKEDLGEYWVGRKHIFYELHFEPIFNSDIDNFSILFYNHSNENSPEFQMI